MDRSKFYFRDNQFDEKSSFLLDEYYYPDITQGFLKIIKEERHSFSSRSYKMIISGKNFTCVQPSKPNNEKTRLPKIKQIVNTPPPQQQQKQEQQQQKSTKKKPLKTIASKNDKSSLPIANIIKSTPEDITIKEDVDVMRKAINLLSSPNGITGSIRIKFNHYNKSFPIYNGVLKWIDVDEEYSFSFVYKGQYSRDLIYNVVEKSGISLEEYMRDENNLVLRDDLGTYFIGLNDGEQYYAYIVEGEDGIGAYGLRITNSPLRAVKDNNTMKSGNTQVSLITNELKSMNVKDLHSEEARRLKEARDIEDVLFS